MSRNVGVLLEERSENTMRVKLKIKDFLDLTGSPGTGYESSTFNFSGSSWFLQILPYGDEQDNNSDIIALFLHREERFPVETFIFEGGIEKANGYLCLRYSFIRKFSEDGYGWRNFSTRSELLQNKSDMLPSGTLTVSFTLKKPSSSKGFNTLFSDFENLLNSEKHSDVTIQVGDTDYKAHKLILATRSPVFDAMFEHEMEEKNSGTIKIADCDPDTFKVFLQFLYTGSADITECNVFHLYRTADKYCVLELKSECVAFMIQNLSVDNVCEVAALGDLYSQFDLNSLCDEFFEQNIQKILLNSKWESLMTENPRVANNLLKYVAPKIKI